MNKIILVLVVTAAFGFVLVDGERIDINENKNFLLKSDDGFNEIEIKDGQIRVVSADCPDQTCVNCGFISKDSFNKIIACIPHRLIIEFR